MELLKLSAILALVVLAASAPASLEGSGDDGVRPRPDDFEGSGDVTRPRPELTTEAPRMKETKCKCYVETHDKERTQHKSHRVKLRDLMGKAANDIKVTFADSDLGCQEALAKCSAFCAGLGKQMAADQLGSQKHGRWSTADWLCYKAKSENPLSIQVVSKLDSCTSAEYLDDMKHHKHDKSNKSNKSAKLEKDDDDDEEEQKKLHSHEKKEKHDKHETHKKPKPKKHDKHNKSDKSNKSAKLDEADDDDEEEQKKLHSHEKKEKHAKHEKPKKHDKSNKSNKSAKLEEDEDEKFDDDDDDDEEHKHSNIWKNSGKHGKHDHQEMVAFTMTDSLCCKKSRRHYAATECDSVATSDGSGDDGVRPRPDELQEE